MTFARPRLPSVFSVVILSVALAAAQGCGSVASSPDAGTAGVGGAAGHDGTAGTSGPAGSGGGAGATGTAGRDGGAGAIGTAGHDGGVTDGGASCTELASQYAAALPAARSCAVGATDQCQQLVSGNLSPCATGCMVPVNDASTLNALKAAWLAEGCPSKGGVVACPQYACVLPTKGNCAPQSAGGGMCATAPLATTN